MLILDGARFEDTRFGPLVYMRWWERGGGEEVVKTKLGVVGRGKEEEEGRGRGGLNSSGLNALGDIGRTSPWITPYTYLGR